MNVLAFASYPVEAAATRYRLHQFISPLAERGISLTIKPFLVEAIARFMIEALALLVGRVKSALLRSEMPAARRADVVLSREAIYSDLHW